jgi:hypothetical protein
MLAARFAFQSPQAAVAANARRVGTASTNAGTDYTAYTASGSTAQTDTDRFKFGSSSMLLPKVASGANQPFNSYIQTTGGTRNWLDVGTSDFTVEWWQYIESPLNTHANGSELLAVDNTSGGFAIRLAQEYGLNGLGGTTPRYISVFARGQADLDYWTLAANWATNTWIFCVIQRKSTTMSCWLNGVLQSRSNGPNGSAGTRNFASGTNIKIGTADGGTGIAPANIDEFCVSNTYRYTDTNDNIPVPTAAFALDSYTTQLMHFEGADGGTTFENTTS